MSKSLAALPVRSKRAPVWFILLVLSLFFFTLTASSGAAAAQADAKTAVLRIAIVGDSTVADYKSDDPQRGWGQFFPEFVDRQHVTVRNFAVNGRSTKTFKNEGRWTDVLAFNPNYIFIQFGHNDSHAKDRPESTDAKTDYSAYLREYVESAHKQGATAILVTPMHRGKWDQSGQHLTQELRPYVEAMRQVAHEKNAPLIDLYTSSERAFEQLGVEGLKTLFAQPTTDQTHFNEKGARLLANLVIEGTDRAVPALKIYLKGSGATRPSLNSTAQAPTLFLIGDSTVRNGQGNGSNGQWGWGDAIASFFDPAKINVVNRARGGRSSRTYITEGLWNQVVEELKPGDLILVQFGHNDTSPVNDESRARGSLPGAGEETQEIDNLVTKQHEIVHTYGWYLRKMLTEAKAKGALPIVCSPVPRLNWKDGKPVRSFEGYRQWDAEAARGAGVPFIDLNEIITRQYEALGMEKVEPLFVGDHTHTSRAGAELNAAAVIAGLKALRENPLAPYLSPRAAQVSAAGPIASQSAFTRWEKEIVAYEQMDGANPPPKGALLFIGSSTIRLWKTLAQDFPEHRVINRGFGGSEIADATHFAERIIFPYEPRMIFLRAGGNDIHAGKSPAQVFADYKQFVAKISARLPAAEIVFISLSPSIARWNEADQNKELNKMIKEYTKQSPRLKYIETYDIVLGPDGKPRPELFIEDKLHFNAAGYKLLTERVRASLKDKGGK